MTFTCHSYNLQGTTYFEGLNLTASYWIVKYLGMARFVLNSQWAHYSCAGVLAAGIFISVFRWFWFGTLAKASREI